MFERWNEMLKNQPDWLEVAMPPGTYEAMKASLVRLGITPEQAVAVFAERLIASSAEQPVRAVQEIANSAIRDLMTQSLIEPTGNFYHVELPDYANPAFVTATKSYFGTLDDLSAFFTAYNMDDKSDLRELHLTEVPVLATRNAHTDNFLIEHLNIHNCAYYMSGTGMESVHVWLKHDNRYYRCVRARLTDLHYDTEPDGQPKRYTGTTWGFPAIIDYSEPYTYNRLYETERIFNTWEEAEADIRAFSSDAVLTEFFNDIFGDG